MAASVPKYIAAAILLTALISGPVLAQESADTARSGKRRLEEVIVSATKRDKSAREIPASINAFDGESLEKEGIFSLEEIVRRAPGVSLTKNLGGDNVRLTIRGIETQLATLGGSQTFGIFFDTVSLVNPTVAGSQPDIDAYDLQSVELLKGPQGTLFGGAALAGAARYVPAKANPEAFSGKVFYSRVQPEHASDFGEDFGAAVNIPLYDRLAVRVTSTRREYAGHIDNLTPGYEEKDVNKYRNEQARGILNWNPIDPLSFQYVYQQLDYDEEEQGHVDNPTRHERSNTPTKSPSKSKVIIKGGKIEYDFSELVPKAPFSLTAELYDIIKDRDQILALERALGTEDEAGSATSQFNTASTSESKELRFTSTGPTNIDFGWGIFKDWEWLIGYVEQETDQYLLVTVDSDPLAGTLSGIPGLSDVPLNTNTSALAVTQIALTLEKAVFFDVTRTFFDKLEVNYGGRFFEMESTESVDNDVNGVRTESDSTAPTIDDYNPKYSLTWHFNDDLRVFYSASKGFRFGGSNFFVVPVEDETAPDQYLPDELWNYELGIRSAWLDGSLTLDLTAFEIDWSDIQIIQSSANGVDNFIANIGKAKVEGAEFAFQWASPWRVTFSGNASYIDARTDEAFEAVDGTVAAGTRLPASSEWMGSIRALYETTVYNVDIATTLTHTFKGDSETKLILGDHLEDLQTTDFSLNITPQHWQFKPTFRFVVSNIFNEVASSNTETYEASGPPSNPSNETNVDHFLNRPRTITATVELSI